MNSQTNYELTITNGYKRQTHRNFKEFPGIGERQARRFVYFLMGKTNAYVDNLSILINELKQETKQCSECFRFFNLRDSTDKNTCEICINKNTDSSVLMIVEKDSDLESVRKSRAYHGKYFILGGLVPIVEKNTKKNVRIEELKEKISKEEGLKEIVLAFSVSPPRRPYRSIYQKRIEGFSE